MMSAQATILYNEFGNHVFDIAATSSKDEWIIINGNITYGIYLYSPGHRFNIW